LRARVAKRVGSVVAIALETVVTGSKGRNAIIALRGSKLSGRFEDFWERRSDQSKVAA
jgi:hypothetical protein